MIGALLSRLLLLPESAGATHREVAALSRRQRFSRYLNYEAWDPEGKVYHNQNGTYGLLWECTPAVFVGLKSLRTLEGVFRAGLPDDSVLQFILYGDPHVKPAVDLYRRLHCREHPLVREDALQMEKFIDRGVRGSEEFSQIPLRNFRLFVGAAIPKAAFKTNGAAYPRELGDIERQIRESLYGTGLNPRPAGPEVLLEWLRRLFNPYPGDYPEANLGAYDDRQPLRAQVINAETEVAAAEDGLKIGANHWCCLTPKVMSRTVDPLQTNILFGGIQGLASNSGQINTPFLYSLNIVFRPLKTKLHAKTNFVLQQQAFGSLSLSLRRKQEEYLRASDELEKGTRFVQVMPTFWCFDRDRSKTLEATTRARRIWENNGFLMQQEREISKILFLASLPFGLYLDKHNLRNIERDFIAPAETVAAMLPVQADFSGTGLPRLLFYGRKGQVATLDLFHRAGVNRNLLVAATSGAGKSFLINYLTFNYYGCNALVRLIDIGGSYKKMTSMLGARYIDFEPGTRICLNPFTNIPEPQGDPRREEELKKELESCTAIFNQMAYSNSATGQPDEVEANMMKNAVRWAWEQEGPQADSDTVYSFLTMFPAVPGEGYEEWGSREELTAAARKLAWSIREFTSRGDFKHVFTGPSDFDIRSDEFVVTELEHLRNSKQLYRVVTLLVINAIAQDLYLSDRSRERFIVFDEAWQFMGEAALLADVIAEGYRKARKYRGSFCVVVQSLLDLHLFRRVGTVINGNSAWKFLLQSGDFAQARADGIIDYDEFTMEMLESVKSMPPRYSEIFMDTPLGRGVSRLVVNPFAYYLYTSDAAEVAEIESLVAGGMSYAEAIHAMVEQHGK